MKKFDLWFPKPFEPGKEEQAETAMVSGKSAYICLTDPFDDGSGQHHLVKSDGRILILNEATSAGECCAQIEELIDNLESLKATAQRHFNH